MSPIWVQNDVSEQTPPTHRFEQHDESSVHELPSERHVLSGVQPPPAPSSPVAPSPPEPSSPPAPSPVAPSPPAPSPPEPSLPLFWSWSVLSCGFEPSFPPLPPSPPPTVPSVPPPEPSLPPPEPSPPFPPPSWPIPPSTSTSASLPQPEDIEATRKPASASPVSW